MCINTKLCPRTLFSHQGKFKNENKYSVLVNKNLFRIPFADLTDERKLIKHTIEFIIYNAAAGACKGK